jgi:SAM-dependent methyltransferase
METIYLRTGHRPDRQLPHPPMRDSPIEIVERDDGYIDTAASTASYFAPVARWPRRRAIRLARGSQALDVGCGAGRVALYLREQGYRVTAIDSSPLAITTCRHRGVRDARVLPFELIGSLRGRRFDTVVMFGNNFGLFGSVKRAKTLLKALHGRTSTSAVILAESIDPYRTNNPLHARYQRRNRRRGRMPGQLRIRVRFQRYATTQFDYLFVSPTEMHSVVAGTGWKQTDVIEDGSAAYVGVLEKM